METIIITTDEKKIKGLIAFLKAFNIPYERKRKKESPYDPDFVKKIEKARGETGKKVTDGNLWEDIK